MALRHLCVCAGVNYTGRRCFFAYSQPTRRQPAVQFDLAGGNVICQCVRSRWGVARLSRSQASLVLSECAILQAQALESTPTSLRPLRHGRR